MFEDVFSKQFYEHIMDAIISEFKKCFMTKMIKNDQQAIGNNCFYFAML